MTTTTTTKTITATTNSALLPPWLWLWLVTYFISLPSYFARLQQSWATATYRSPLPGAVGFGQSLLGINAFLEIIPMCALFLGVLGLAFPTARAAYVEKTYGLTTPETSTGAIAAIINFLQQQAPTLRVKINPLCAKEYAFVYPLGFRKTGIGICGPLIKLWRQDQPIAEAILLHELAHHRQGDAFVVSAGSPFRAVVERWFLLYGCLFVVPFAIAAITVFTTFWSELNTLSQLGISWLSMMPQLIVHVIGNVIFLAFGALATTAGLLLWTLSLFILPLAGLWCSEFNADQAAAQHARGDILSALAQLPKASDWRHWLFSRMSHPPNRLRRWFLGKPQQGVGLLLLLLAFPLTYVVRLVVVSGMAISLGSVDLVGNWAWGLRTIAPVWGAIALILLLWPWLSARWQRFLTRSQGVVLPPQLSPMPYWVSAGMVIVLAIIGYSQQV